MSNRPKLIRTKLPLSVAAIKAENERRAKLPEPEEGEENLEALPTDRRSRRRMRRRVPLVGLIAQAQHQAERLSHTRQHNHGSDS